MNAAEIVEVGPRDGFQAVVPLIPTGEKIRVCQGLIEAGIVRLEAGAFVSPKAIPQMADIREVLEAIGRPEGLRVSVLVPNAKGGLLALEAGVDEIVFVISVSEAHNRSNVRRSVADSFADLAGLLRGGPAPVSPPAQSRHLLRLPVRGADRAGARAARGGTGADAHAGARVRHLRHDRPRLPGPRPRA